MSVNLRYELVTGGAKIFNGKRQIGFWGPCDNRVFMFDTEEVVGWAETPEDAIQRLYRGCVYVWKMKEKK